jgi:hypothetical protein
MVYFDVIVGPPGEELRGSLKAFDCGLVFFNGNLLWFGDCL